MKKSIVLFILLFGMQPFLSAQHNVVGLHLQPLAFGEVRVSFEHAFTNKIAGAINYGHKIPGDIPKFILEVASPTDYGLPINTINEIKGFQVVPELRFYFKDNDKPEGLYVAPYFRYSNYSIEYTGTVNYEFSPMEYNDLPQDVRDYMQTNNLGNKLDVNTVTTGDFIQKGFGIQLGYQWIIGNRLAIDFYFLGLELDKIDFTAEAYSPDANDLGIDYTQWEDEIEGSINFTEDIPLIDVDVVLDVQSDKVIGKANTLAPWFRGGFKIGFAL